MAAAIPPLPFPPAPAVRAFGIFFDLHTPAAGIRSLLPPGHVHRHRDRWYYTQIQAHLVGLGYHRVEQSGFAATGIARHNAIADACQMQSQATLTWMAVPGVVSRMHVVEFLHAGSLY